MKNVDIVRLIKYSVIFFFLASCKTKPTNGEIVLALIAGKNRTLIVGQLQCRTGSDGKRWCSACEVSTKGHISPVRAQQFDVVMSSTAAIIEFSVRYGDSRGRKIVLVRDTKRLKSKNFENVVEGYPTLKEAQAKADMHLEDNAELAKNWCRANFQ